MNIFPRITFELNYKWLSEEVEGKEKSLNTSVQNSRCAHLTSADLDELRRAKMNHYNMGFELLSDLANIHIQSVKKMELNTALRQFYQQLPWASGLV